MNTGSPIKAYVLAIASDPFGRRTVRMNAPRQGRHGFWSCRWGMAALEFVLCAPLFIVVLGGAWDLGFAQSCRTSLANAVAAGAWYALFQGTSVTAANISSVVKNSSYLNIAFMSVTVNGPGTYCFNSSTPPALVSQSTTCADGSSPGTYVIITANYTNNGLMNGFMSAATLTMTEKATVRVQ